MKWGSTSKAAKNDPSFFQTTQTLNLSWSTHNENFMVWSTRWGLHALQTVPHLRHLGQSYGPAKFTNLKGKCISVVLQVRLLVVKAGYSRQPEIVLLHSHLHAVVAQRCPFSCCIATLRLFLVHICCCWGVLGCRVRYSLVRGGDPLRGPSPDAEPDTDWMVMMCPSATSSGRSGH